MAMKFMHWAPVLGFALALPWAAQANNSNSAVSKEVSTATAHAGMAVGAADLKTAHAHLQHVINCLVGPSGEGYDAKEANPCQGMGQGAIVDAKSDNGMGNSSHAERLQAAVDQAEHGLKTTTLSDAQADAQKVVSSLQTK